MLKPVIWCGYVLNDYLIDDNGDIWSKKNSIILKPQINRDGYVKVMLPTPKGHKFVSIHRLVAETFIGPIGKGLVINHIDGNKENNYVGNIEITTHKLNTRHAMNLGLWRRGDGGRAKIPVIGINKISGYMKEWPSISEAALAVAGKVSASAKIHNVLSGLRPSAYGWFWIRN